MSHLTKYTNKPVSVKARVIGIFIKETSAQAKKRKKKSLKNKPPVKRRVFILEDVTSMSGQSLLSHSFIYDENMYEFKNVKPGDSIIFNQVNFYAFGKPDFEHDSTFQLEYSHNIEFTSKNIREIVTSESNKYIFKIPGTNKAVCLESRYNENKYKTFRGINQGVSVITNTDLWKNSYDLENVNESQFMKIIKEYKIDE